MLTQETDIAAFTGSRDEYIVTLLEDGRVVVSDKVPDRDGEDKLKDVEILEFSDGRFRPRWLTDQR